MEIKEVLKDKSLVGKEIELFGWIKNHRKQKEFGFIDFSDGTCFKHLQLVYNDKLKHLSRKKTEFLFFSNF